MKINPIATYQINSKNKINFKARSIKDRMDDEREKSSWWEWHVEGKKDIAEINSQHQLNHECNKSEKEALIAEKKADSYYESTRSKLNAQENIIRKKEAILNKLQDQTYENNRTIDELRNEIESDRSSVRYNGWHTQDLKNEQKDLVNKRKMSEKALSNLNKELQKNKRNSASNINSKVKQAEQLLKAERNARLVETEQTYQNADSIIEDILKFTSPKQIGLAKIQGYEQVKNSLNKILGIPLMYTKQGNENVEIPNGILLFGPQGCGKTTIARGFAQDSGCIIQYFKPTMNNDKAYNQLVDIVNGAKRAYQEKGRRTIILVDEFDAFAPKNSDRSQRMKNLTDKISKQYYCTIIATTNFPENIDTKLLRDGRFEKIAVGIANKEDLIKIIHYYLNGCFDSYNEIAKLADNILGNPNGKYSNSQIKDIIDSCINTSIYTKIGLNSKRLLQKFAETIPDISNEAFEHFQKQLQYIKKV